MDAERLVENGTRISLESLPEDFQVLILQILEESGVLLKEEQLASLTFPVKVLPMRAFPEVAILSENDDRDISYSEAMVGQDLPPILLCKNQWIDGRHRVWALKKVKAKQVTCIDLQEIMCSYMFPHIATLNLA